MTYCYKCTKCNNTFDVSCSASQRKSVEECPECKSDSERDYGSELAGTQAKRWDVHSAALAENDVQGASERAKKHGVPTTFDDIGCPIFTSGGHQKRYMKMLYNAGAVPAPLINRSAYY